MHCVHTWLLRDPFPEFGLAFFFFPSTMPTFTVNLVSFGWRVRVPYHPRPKCVYARTGTGRDGFAFSFLDFRWKSCLPRYDLPFPLRHLFNRN